MILNSEAGRDSSPRELLRAGKHRLSEAGIPDAETDAWLLLEGACGMDRQAYLLHGEEPAGPEAIRKYAAFLERRLCREPVQYILGEAWLFGRPFHVTPDVLIPRLDTEVLVEETLRRMQPGMRILDLCTGSGCILLSLLAEADGRVSGCGTDLSQAALNVAAENQRRLGLQAEWVCSDLFARVAGTYDIIVSNPPYIASGCIAGLDEEVRAHEPHLALDGGEDGLRILQRITEEAPAYLNDGGWLLLEIGWDQGPAVRQLLADAGFKQTEIIKDMSGLDRVAAGRSRHV